MIAQTIKFGVEVNFDENGNLNSSESYREWINFYENHFSNVLSDEKLLFFKNAFIIGKLLMSYYLRIIRLKSKNKLLVDII